MSCVYVVVLGVVLLAVLAAIIAARRGTPRRDKWRGANSVATTQEQVIVVKRRVK